MTALVKTIEKIGENVEQFTADTGKTVAQLAERLDALNTHTKPDT